LVKAKAVNYISVIDGLTQQTKEPLDGLTTVARGEARDLWRRVLTDQGRDGWKQVGDSRVVESRFGRFGSHQGRPQVRATICVDVGAVDVIDRSGESVVQPSRLDRSETTLTLERWGSGWFVTDDVGADRKC